MRWLLVEDDTMIGAAVLEQVSAAIAKAGKSVALLIQRGDEKIFVLARPGSSGLTR